ncbi:hypothetical protein ABPG77_004199 [Micractinium sp. CCAP 211/92]
MTGGKAAAAAGAKNSGGSSGNPPPKGSSGGKSLQSFPVPTAIEDVEQEEVDEEVHKDEECTIKVTQSPGFLCHIEATAAFRMPAQTLFKQVICHPGERAGCTTHDRCAYRRVLSDDGRGRRRVRVAHEASWRFLLLHGTFTTKLLVEEDDRELTMAFQLDPDGGTGGIMRRFHGRWQIRPHPADPEHACMSTLDQDLALGVPMPPPFDRILKRISCNQVRKIFEDVKREAEKIRRGKPTLKPWEEVRDKAIGEEGQDLPPDGGTGLSTAAGAAGPAATPTDGATETAAANIAAKQ